MTIQYTDADGAPLRGSALGTRCFGQLAKGELPVGRATCTSTCSIPTEVPLDAEEVDEWCMDRWRTKATMLEGVPAHGKFKGTEPWPTSGGAVPSFSNRRRSRIFSSRKGSLRRAARLLASFAAYAVVAYGGLAVMCQMDPPGW